MFPFKDLVEFLLPEFYHHIRNFNILFRNIFCSNFENDVLLVIRNWLLANGLDKLTQSVVRLVVSR